MFVTLVMFAMLAISAVLAVFATSVTLAVLVSALQEPFLRGTFQRHRSLASDKVAAAT